MAAVWTASADYIEVVRLCREALAKGGELRGLSLLKVIDVVQHAANTLDGESSADGRTDITAADGIDGRAG